MLRTTLLLAVLSLAVSAEARTRVTGLDSVTTVGQPVALRAKFEGGISVHRPDKIRKAVTFTQVESGLQLHARTDWDGVASTVARAQKPGVYRFRATLDRSPSRSGQSRLWVLDPAVPVVVIDIDGTLSTMHELLVAFRGRAARTFPGAPELVRELSRTHQVIYLTARDDALDVSTRLFLARHGFPDAPVLYNDMGLNTRGERAQLLNKHEIHGVFKLGVLEALQDRGVNLVLGIGNAETDAYAYEGAGLPSMILTTEPGHGGSSFRFTQYVAQLRPKLQELGFLAPSVGMAVRVPRPE